MGSTRTKARRRANDDTSVAITKSRKEIDDILKGWGVKGIQWEDNFETGETTLRFRWKREVDDSDLVARFHVSIPSDEKLEEMAIDKRSGKYSQKKFERLKLERGKKEHRVLASFIKNAFEAINEGIIPAEALLMPWLEDATGKTVYDKVEPVLGQLASSPLHMALKSGGKE